MRAIHLVSLDKVRPALLLTRERMVGRLTRITVAPITSTIRGIPTEVVVGTDNGLDHESVVSLDNVRTVPASSIGRQIGFLAAAQERALTEALMVAYDLVRA